MYIVSALIFAFQLVVYVYQSPIPKPCCGYSEYLKKCHHAIFINWSNAHVTVNLTITLAGSKALSSYLRCYCSNTACIVTYSIFLPCNDIWIEVFSGERESERERMRERERERERGETLSFSLRSSPPLSLTMHLHILILPIVSLSGWSCSSGQLPGHRHHSLPHHGQGLLWQQQDSWSVYPSC